MPDHVDALLADPDIKPLIATNWLRPHQIEDRKREVDEMAQALSDPVTVKNISNPMVLKRQNEERRRILNAQLPPSVSGPVMDKVVKTIGALEADVKEGMLSAEEERHPDERMKEYARRWEADKKPRLLALKRLLLVRDRGTDNRAVADLRYLQPREGQSRNLHTGALIPGQFALSPQAKANYDAINWDSPEVQAEIAKRIASGELKINLNAKASDIGPKARGERKPGKVFECKETGQIFSGAMAAARFARHQKKLAKQKVLAQAG